MIWPDHIVDDPDSLRFLTKGVEHERNTAENPHKFATFLRNCKTVGVTIPAFRPIKAPIEKRPVASIDVVLGPMFVQELADDRVIVPHGIAEFHTHEATALFASSFSATSDVIKSMDKSCSISSGLNSTPNSCSSARTRFRWCKESHDSMVSGDASTVILSSAT